MKIRPTWTSVCAWCAKVPHGLPRRILGNSPDFGEFRQILEAEFRSIPFGCFSMGLRRWISIIFEQKKAENAPSTPVVWRPNSVQKNTEFRSIPFNSVRAQFRSKNTSKHRIPLNSVHFRCFWLPQAFSDRVGPTVPRLSHAPHA